MHSTGEMEALSPDKKELLGLTDGESSANQINKDTFARDFQNINKILQELNREVIILVLKNNFLLINSMTS